MDSVAAVSTDGVVRLEQGCVDVFLFTGKHPGSLNCFSSMCEEICTVVLLCCSLIKRKYLMVVLEHFSKLSTNKGQLAQAVISVRVLV